MSLLEFSRTVIDEGGFCSSKERNALIAVKLGARYPSLQEKFTDETVRTQLRTLAGKFRAGNPMVFALLLIFSLPHF